MKVKTTKHLSLCCIGDAVCGSTDGESVPICDWLEKGRVCCPLCVAWLIRRLCDIGTSRALGDAIRYAAGTKVAPRQKQGSTRPSPWEAQQAAWLKMIANDPHERM